MKTSLPLLLSSKGFTLVELIIAVSILTSISMIVMVSSQAYMNKQKLADDATAVVDALKTAQENSIVVLYGKRYGIQVTDTQHYNLIDDGGSIKNSYSLSEGASFDSTPTVWFSKRYGQPDTNMTFKVQTNQHVSTITITQGGVITATVPVRR